MSRVKNTTQSFGNASKSAQRRKIGLELCGAALLSTSALAAHAQLYVYEGFNYPVGQNSSANTLNGGSGWDRAWFSSPPVRNTVSNSLAYGNLATSGGAIQSISQTSFVPDIRTFAGAGLGAAGTDLYLSFLLRPNYNVTNSLGIYGGINFGNADGANIFIGKPGANGDYVLQRGDLTLVDSGIAAASNTTAFLVAHFAFAAGNDTIELYVNPVPGRPLVTLVATVNDVNLGDVAGDFNLAYLNDNGNGFGTHTFDEIRIGKTYADVSPLAVTNGGSVPEPGAFALIAGVAVSGACFVMKRRKR